jgi:endonuclease/exonuclease/phosphatase (EEP) superfamily protein YafD
MSYEPDVLLLQERPDRQPLAAALGKYDGYAVAQGADGAIIARGTVSPAVTPADYPTTQAALVEVGDRRLGIVNVHLHLPDLEPVLWSREAWRQAAERFRVREAQTEVAVRAAGTFGDGVPVIVGGDFNTPPGDLLFRDLPADLRDCFKVAGVGVGHTIITDMPIERVDYVWAPEPLEIHSVVVRRTHHSDHRLVVADLAWPAPQGRAE